MRGMGFHSPLASADLPPGHLRFTGVILAKVYEQNLLNLCLNCKLSTLVCQVLISVFVFPSTWLPLWGSWHGAAVTERANHCRYRNPSQIRPLRLWAYAQIHLSQRERRGSSATLSPIVLPVDLCYNVSQNFHPKNGGHTYGKIIPPHGGPGHRPVRDP